MSERKVLNKYYPPDFDPTKLPKLKLAKERQYVIRTMAPFNMRCKTCGEYIYKGKKFNARKETVQNEDYLGLRIFRFYIKCPRCLAEITFKTDPATTDYVCEHGATRNFEAERTARLAEEKALKEKEEEEADNPMLLLEKRTRDSRLEMERLEQLEELRDMNMRHANVAHDDMITFHLEYEKQLRRLQEEEDEKFIESVFGKKESEADGLVIKRLKDDSSDEEEVLPSSKKLAVAKPPPSKPTDILTRHEKKEEASSRSWQKSTGTLGTASNLVKTKKSSLAQLVRPKSTSVDSAKNEADIGRNSTTLQSPNSNTDMSKSLAEQKPSGLGMLGNYSDSDSNNSDE